MTRQPPVTVASHLSHPQEERRGLRQQPARPASECLAHPLQCAQRVADTTATHQLGGFGHALGCLFQPAVCNIRAQSPDKQQHQAGERLDHSLLLDPHHRAADGQPPLMNLPKTHLGHIQPHCSGTAGVRCGVRRSRAGAHYVGAQGLPVGRSTAGVRVGGRAGPLSFNATG